jgi:hypothetical protein
MAMKKTSGGDSPLRQGAGKSFWTLPILGQWRWWIVMYSGKVIRCLGFSRRGVFIGKGAASEVDQVGLTTGGRGPGVGRAPGGVAPQWHSLSPLRFSGRFGEFLDVRLLFRPIPRIFPV